MYMYYIQVYFIIQSLYVICKEASITIITYILYYIIHIYRCADGHLHQELQRHGRVHSILRRGIYVIYCSLVYVYVIVVCIVYVSLCIFEFVYCIYV